MLDGDRRDRQGIRDGSHEDANIDELIWKQDVPLVRELGLEFDRTSRHVDLIVSRQQFPLRQQARIRPVIGIHPKRLAGKHWLADGRQLAFWQGKHDSDRLGLRDHHDSLRIVGHQQVTNINLP